MCTCTCLFTTYTIIKYILPHQETIWKGQGRQTVSWWIWRLQWLEMEPISLVLSCLKVGEAIALFCFVVFLCVLPWACDVDALLPQLWFLLVSAGAPGSVLPHNDSTLKTRQVLIPTPLPSCDCKLQSVAKLMTHLTVYGEFSSIPNLGKTSPPPPCTMLTRHEMTIVPERVINIDWGGGGKFGKRYFF